MDLSLTTPSLLFPAISLLLLAYTNRFLAIAQLIRSLHSQGDSKTDIIISGQIESLKKRVKLIKDMQIYGVASFFLCVFCMFLLYTGKLVFGRIVFAFSLILLMISLGFSIYEVIISTEALNIQLKDCDTIDDCNENSKK